MDRRPRLLTALAVGAALAAALVGCGDAIFVAGDTPGVMRVVAGEPGDRGSTLGELATESRMNGPAGVTVDDEGVLYIADAFNARILAVEPSGRIREVLDHAARSDSLRLRRPAGIDLLEGGRLVVADPASNRIWRVAVADGSFGELAGDGSQDFAPDGSPAAGSPVARPFDVMAGPAGDVYFSERGANRVRAIGTDGTLRTVAGDGRSAFGGDGGPATEASLRVPAGIWVREDRLFVVDAGNFRVREVDLVSGTIRTVAGVGVPGFDGDGGPAIEARLTDPLYVTVSADGRTLFVSDAGNHRVRAVSLATGLISTFAGTGETAFTGDLEEAGTTALSRPAGLVATPFDLLFLVDAGHQIVWRTAIRF